MKPEPTSGKHHVVAVPGTEEEQSKRPLNRPSAYTLRGSTSFFTVYYETNLGAEGQSAADAVLGRCESDYKMLFNFFGGLTPGNLPFQIYIDQGSNGGWHAFCYTTLIYVDDFGGSPYSADVVNLVNVAEISEVFMASQGIGWDCGSSNGEGLSRVLGEVAYVRLPTFATGKFWLDGARPDWVTNNEPTDLDNVATGCSALFLNYLRHQLDFSWAKIVQSGAPSLSQTYTKLTKRDDAFAPFAALLQQRFPAGTASGLADDNPFPTNQQLQLCGLTQDGNVWHAIRFPDELWTPFGNVKGQAGDPGQFVAIASAGVNREFQVAGVTTDGGMWHTIRDVNGLWDGFGNVKGQAGDPGPFVTLACARVDGELHLCGITGDGGMWHTIRHLDGSWDPFVNVKAKAGDDPGPFVSVACTCVSGRLEVCGVTADGNLWHTARGGLWWLGQADPYDHWYPFENVGLALSNTFNPGRFTRVSCAGVIGFTGKGTCCRCAPRQKTVECGIRAIITLFVIGRLFRMSKVGPVIRGPSTRSGAPR